MTGLGLTRPTKVTTRTGPANQLLAGGEGEFQNAPVLFEVPDEAGEAFVRGRSFLVDGVDMVNLDQPTPALRVKFVDPSVDPVEVNVDVVVTVHHVEFFSY